MRIVNNEPDYGIQVNFILRNEGKSGLINVRTWLTCSDGEWSREQRVTLDESESMSFTYFFHEPTINATNIQYGVNVDPKG
jgi:hypothetical protein